MEPPPKEANFIARALRFFDRGLWRIPCQDLPPAKSFGIRVLRILALTARGFREDKCQLRASALTFYSLISIVPILALAFGVAKGFGLDGRLHEHIVEQVPSGNEVILQAINIAQVMLEQTKAGVVAGIGVLVLLWSVLRVIGSIEHSFNDIWGLKKPRSIARKFSDYLAVVVICPTLLIVSSSAAVFLATRVRAEISGTTGYTEIATGAGNFILALAPYIFAWLLFTFLYAFMPNTKVRWRSALVGGVIAGTAYQLLQVLFISSQLFVSKYNAIYGSFSALPLFLLWLQFSWTIVMLGAELSFSHQNSDAYEFEPDANEASHAIKRLLSLRITQLLATRFELGEPPLTAEQIAHHLESPARLERLLLFDLVGAGVLNEVSMQEDVVGYQPARTPDQLTIAFVIEAIENHGESNIPHLDSPEFRNLAERFNSIRQRLAAAPENMPLHKI